MLYFQVCFKHPDLLKQAREACVAKKDEVNKLKRKNSNVEITPPAKIIPAPSAPKMCKIQFQDNESEEETNVSEESEEQVETEAPVSEESEESEEETDGECHLGADYPGTTIGHLTVYAASPSGNNCDLNWSNLEASGLKGWTHFAALPKNPGTDADRYEAGANCGRCVKVKCSCHQELFPGACAAGEEVIVMVTDSCPSCPYVGDLDLSNAAWDDVSGNEGPSKYDGTWEFIECPSDFKTGPMKLRMKGGSSKYWHAFQPENHKNKVTSMSINGVEMIFGDIDGFWWKGNGIMEFPCASTARVCRRLVGG